MSGTTPNDLVRVMTPFGDLLIEVDRARAPVSASAFLRFVDDGGYTGGSFVRTVSPANDHGTPPIAVIQAFATRTESMPTVPHESTGVTGLTHMDGTVSLPRLTGTGGTPASFFICIGDQPGLDAGTGRIADRAGFAAFGRLAGGDDVAREIHCAPTRPDAPHGYLAGQMLRKPVAILAARREPAEDSARLHALVHDYWAFRNHEFPVEASLAGVAGHGDRLDGMSLDDHARRSRVAARLLRRLDAIRAAELAAQDADTHALLRHQLTLMAESWRIGAPLVPQLYIHGFQDLPMMLAQMTPLNTRGDVEDLLSRLEGMPGFFDANLLLLEEGFARGYRVPRPILGRVRQMLAASIADSGVAGVLRARLADPPSGLNADAMTALRTRAEHAVSKAVLPALRRFDAFLVEHAERICTSSVSVCEQPGGEAYYRFRIIQQTTTMYGPAEIHRIGLDEVAKIHSEIQAVLAAAGFSGTAREYAATIESCVEATGESLLTRTRALAKQIDGRLPRIIGRLPRAVYTVEPFTPEQSVALPPGMAEPAPPDCSMPGVYRITALPRKCPVHLLVSLGLHEAWPGHLMQFALASELESLPGFRRACWSDCNGYVEGWALYCEWLGHELGLYDEPADHFGQLTFDLWRAARLVVDTGLHWYRWERERAISYMAENTFMPPETIESEIDRYIGMPAQALSYKLGERVIRALRSEAEARLGERFSVRGFHDALLATGPVTLDVAASAVRRWIDTQHRLDVVAV